MSPHSTQAVRPEEPDGRVVDLSLGGWDIVDPERLRGKDVDEELLSDLRRMLARHS